MCLPTCIYTQHIMGPGPAEARKVLDTPGLELQTVVRPMWVLAIELGRLQEHQVLLTSEHLSGPALVRTFMRFVFKTCSDELCHRKPFSRLCTFIGRHQLLRGQLPSFHSCPPYWYPMTTQSELEGNVCSPPAIADSTRPCFSASMTLLSPL